MGNRPIMLPVEKLGVHSGGKAHDHNPLQAMGH